LSSDDEKQKKKT
jgi:hypothetical protein